MHSLRQQVMKVKPGDCSSFVLAGDIGGTNTNLGVLGVTDGRPTPLFSMHFRSQELESLIPAVIEVLDYAKKEYGIELDAACMAGAGPVSPGRDRIGLTNVKWDIDAGDLVRETDINTAYMVNDFEAVGYGINLLDHDNEEDILVVRHGRECGKAAKAVIGAGTGIGKGLLVYDERHKAYLPLPSEGGHGDFPAQDSFDLELLDFIRVFRGVRQVSYEEVVAGKGIEAIYQFLKEKKAFKATGITQEIDASGDKVPLIARYKDVDDACRQTFRHYARYYGRCAKNYVLDTMAVGGLYIAGGVASKNSGIFRSKEFVGEFENANKQSNLLKGTAIYVVPNYDVSLIGAGYAAVIGEYGKVI